MEQFELRYIAQRWSDMSGKVLELKEIPSEELRFLLRDTYEVLYFYHCYNDVPKEIIRILSSAHEFLYFASMMENTEVPNSFYYYVVISEVLHSMEYGFLKGEFACEFPVLKLQSSLEGMYVIDLENNRLECLM